MPCYIGRNELLRTLGSLEPPVVIEALGAAFYADAHLPGAHNMPPAVVDQVAPLILPDLDTAVVVYCSSSCDSSHIVARRLELLGYADVRIYSGGKEDWVEHGLPVERGSGDVDA